MFLLLLDYKDVM